MGKETSERIQTSILNRLEKNALVWLAERQPVWVTSDMLSYTGVAGAVLFVVFSYMGNANPHFLWLAALGLVVNWYGDSLDGTLARVRNTQRPLYGFFIDHSLDAITTCLICVGIGVSPYMSMDIALFILAGYLCMSIYTYLSTIIIGKFRLTYGNLGPTEVRIIVIIVSLLYLYFPLTDTGLEFCGRFWPVYDIVGVAVAAILFIIYISSMVADLRKLAVQDPAKPFKK